MRKNVIHRVWIASAALAGMLTVPASPGVLAQGTGSKPRPMGHSRLPPPVDIRQLWDESEVVAVFRVESERPGPDSEPCQPLTGAGWTLYQVRVGRAFKGSDVVRAKTQRGLLPILRIGCKTGDAVFDSRLDDGFPPFRIGEEVVGFLRARTGIYSSYMCPYHMGVGVYQLRDGRVRARSDAPISKRQNGRKADDLLKELADLAQSAKQGR